MRFYSITYIAEGGKVDWMQIWCDSLTGAIKQFTETEQEIGGYKFKYSEHAIRNIKC